MGIDPKHVAGTDDVMNKFSAVLAGLIPDGTVEGGNLYHIITAVGGATLRNYTTLRNAFVFDDQVMMAWSCRNLLELQLFTVFALSSKENAKTFADDRLVDGKQIIEKLIKLERYLDPTITSSPLDNLQNTMTQKAISEGITRTRFIDTRELAGQQGMAEEFDTVNRIASKLVHPTAWSLLTDDIKDQRFPQAGELFYGTGAKYALTVAVTVQDHVKQFGMRHKP